jgi:hypothetical protein
MGLHDLLQGQLYLYLFSLFAKYNSDDQIQEAEMDGTCSTNETAE